MIEEVFHNALKIRIKPNPKQENLFWQCCGAARYAYNWALSTVESDYENGKKSVNASDLKKRFVVAKNTNPDMSFFNDLSCDIPKGAIDHLCEAYSRFFDICAEENYEPYTKKTLQHAAITKKELTRIDMNGHPKYKCKKHKKRDSFYVDWFQVKIEEGRIWIPKVGWVLTRNSHKGLQTFPLKKLGKSPKMVNATVSWDGKYWIFSASFEFSPEENNDPETEPVGVDRGIKETAVCSDGKVYPNINKSKKVRKLKKKLKRLQRKLSRKFRTNGLEKSSNNAKKTMNQIRKIYRKLTNIRQNQRHQISNDIVKRKPSFIVLEDLNIKGMMKNKHLSEKFQEQGLYYLALFIEQKAARIGIPVVKASRWFPSSKTCSACGFIKSDLKLKDRTFVCPNCGKSIDRDLNAAINLREYGRRELNLA